MRALPALTLLFGLSSASAAELPSVDTWPDHSNQAPGDAAVVVGIDRYLLVPRVPYATRDARAFWSFLVFDRGVPADRVTLLQNDAATKESIEAAVQSQAARVRPGGTLWFYFAGHGSPDPLGGNDAFLVGVDAQPTPVSLATRSVPRRWLEANLGRSGAGQIELILDSCFSGKTRTGELLAGGLRPLVEEDTPSPWKGTLLTAAGPNQLSGPLDAARHGLFTYFLLGALRGWGQSRPDGPVTVEGAYHYLRQAMAVALAGGDRSQTPGLSSPVVDRKAVLAEGLGERGPELASIVGAAVPEAHRDRLTRVHDHVNAMAAAVRAAWADRNRLTQVHDQLFAALALGARAAQWEAERFISRRGAAPPVDTTVTDTTTDTTTTDTTTVEDDSGSGSQPAAPPPPPPSSSDAPAPFVGTRVTFRVGSSSGDLHRFQVKVSAGDATFECDGARHQPCTLQLPQGKAHAHFDLVLENGQEDSMDQTFEVGTTAEVATPSYSSRHGRFAAGVLCYGVSLVGQIAVGVGLGELVAPQPICYQGCHANSPANAILLVTYGLPATILGAVFGTVLVAGGSHHEDLKVDAAADTPDESAVPERSPAFALRGIGLAPLPGGGGTVGATFAF